MSARLDVTESGDIRPQGAPELVDMVPHIPFLFTRLFGYDPCRERWHIMRVFSMILVTLAACDYRGANVPCEQDSNCDLFAEGACTLTPTGSKWCAYPDTICDSGYRYSDDHVGDNVGGHCTDNGRTLKVMVGGNGSGRVMSTPTGIDCPGTCTATFMKGDVVTLTQAAASSVFLGWSDACSGVSTCMITLDSNKQTGALFGVPGSNVWLSQLHATGGGTIDGAKALSNKDIVVVGSFSGTMTLGSMALTAQPSTMAGFVARLRAADGSVTWINQLDSSVRISPVRVAVDSDDNILVAGHFLGTAVLNGTAVTSAGSVDVFVAKFSGANGGYSWTHTFGDTSLDYVFGLAVDKSGSVAVTGYFNGTIFPGPHALQGTAATYVVKYLGSTGAHMWSRAITGTDTQYGEFPAGLAVDSTGAVVIVGNFAGTVNFGGGGVTATGSTSSFLVKYTGDAGAYVLDKQLGASDPTSVAVDADDNMYVLGTFFPSTLPLGGVPLTNAGGSDVFLVKYSTLGIHQWSKRFGNDQNDSATLLSIDPAGQLLIGGRFKGTVSYGGSSLTSAGDYDIVVARIKAIDGSHLASARFGGTSLELPGAIESSGANIFVGGSFYGVSEFGGQAMTAPSTSSDGFALMMLPLN